MLMERGVGATHTHTHSVGACSGAEGQSGPVGRTQVRDPRHQRRSLTSATWPLLLSWPWEEFPSKGPSVIPYSMHLADTTL